ALPAAPAGIGGDRHSPAVAARAGEALAARDRFVVARSPGAHSMYLRAINAAADAVAFEFGVELRIVRDAWARADLAHQTATLAALSQLGVAYQFNRADPGNAFDCSGLTSYSWSRAGTSIVHQSSAQISAAASRDEGTAMAGDLVQYPGHVMMSLGFDRAIVHAANHDTDVELSRLRDGRSYRFGDPSR
ncbi:MAG: NlpC/P60 family protein, partial [Actinomycetota bacterium]|nr:NlpC/P60 family protein [Actinomycetota bacterium]